MPPPKVSVCLDVFNYAAFLPRAIESVLSQERCDFELIIADDCSTDGSFAIAESYADPRIKLIRNRANLGMVRNRNVALRAARGEYVKPLHADDFLCGAGALATLTAKLDQRIGMSLAACAMRFVDESETVVGKWSCFDSGRSLAGTTVINRCLREERNLIGSPSAVMFRRSCALRGFDDAFFHMADLEMWFHLLEQGCFGWVEEPLCAYRKHPRQQTERDRATFSECDDYDALLARYLGQRYVTLSPWHRQHLLRRAAIQRASRARELGIKTKGISLVTRVSFAVTKIALRQRRAVKKLSVRKSHQRDFPEGINVAGFFEGEYGIGDATRSIAHAVEASGTPHQKINIRSKVHRNEDRSVTRFAAGNQYLINLMTFSFDYSRRFYRDMGPRFFAGHYNIALWYCELEQLSPRWHSSFDYYDEIWVTTEFCQKAIEAVSPVPVIKITPVLLINDVPPARAEWGLPKDAFIFMFSFDYLSVVERKNPQAVIRAFRKAFRGKENVLLVLKSINSGPSTELQEAAKGLNVSFIGVHQSAAELDKLFASIDCYVSLHRSEGLGYGMAKAMSFGKPVIATGYSGNLSFMNESNSLLVRYRLTEIERDYGPYEKGYSWAEPDESHAAELMRWVYEHPKEARELGRKGAESVKATMSVARAGEDIRARVNQIYASRALNTLDA